MKAAYPTKVLIAWGECISGNNEITKWLMQNGYKELGIFRYALHNQDESREWLMKNGHPELMAVINGAEGNPQALMWLEKHGFSVLAHVARVGDGDQKSFQWLKINQPELAMIGKKIQIVKDEIQANNEDVHKISS